MQPFRPNRHFVELAYKTPCCGVFTQICAIDEIAHFNSSGALLSSTRTKASQQKMRHHERTLGKICSDGAMLAMLAACSSKPTDRGQQYSDGKFTSRFTGKPAGCRRAPINAGDFSEQVNQIRNASPRLYNQSNVYNALQEWLRAGGDTRTLRQFGIDAGRCRASTTMATSSLPATTRRWCRRATPVRANSSTPFTVCRRNAVAAVPRQHLCRRAER